MSKMSSAISIFATLAVAHTTTELIFSSYTSPDAMCNDGSRSGLFFQAADAASPHRNTWVVQMEGGGWCWDDKTCAMRSGSLSSSAEWPSSMTPERGSILDAVNTSFEFANKAYQRYCTSDGYIGNGTTSGLHFKGHVVVASLLQDLVDRGMGRDGNATLIFSGCSAGGRGVLHNANFAAKFSRKYGVAHFVALIDSGLYIDVDPMIGSTSVALRDQAKGVAQHASAAIDPVCEAAYPAESWKCLIGQYAVPTLMQPAIIHSFQADAYQLGAVDWGGLRTPHATVVDVRASIALSVKAEDFRSRTRVALSSAIAAGHAVHSADCYHHCNTEGSAFSNTYTVDGVSLKTIVQNFAFRSGGSIHAVDNCSSDTFACGKGCRMEDRTMVWWRD